jgi:hypothetical protein
MLVFLFEMRAISRRRPRAADPPENTEEIPETQRRRE